MRRFGEIRLALGIELWAAAARLNLHPRYLRQLELGRRPLSLPLAERMAVVYRCSIDALVREVSRG